MYNISTKDQTARFIKRLVAQGWAREVFSKTATPGYRSVLLQLRRDARVGGVLDHVSITISFVWRGRTNRWSVSLSTVASHHKSAFKGWWHAQYHAREIEATRDHLGLNVPAA